MNTDTSTDSAYAAAPVLSVSALNQAVARLLERSFPLSWIAGEISNFTRASSGHWYFTLKDDAAQVRAVMFRGRAQFAGFTPREGDKVEVRALVTLYGARGDYQINVEAIRRAGVGALYEAFLRLKEKLGALGLFDPERKRAIPMFARTIGIVTSPQAAALRDILIALKRRAPHVSIVLYPSPVQGQQAPEKIAEAITTASRRAECDVLLVCRGGGSIEDLWSFNDEGVAHAIAACAMPVICGVGHETDFTIADFAADLRAATPTAAAELAATPRADWLSSLRADAGDLRRAMQRSLGEAAQTLDNYSRRLLSPAARIQQQRLQVLALSTAMTHATRTPLNQAHFALDKLRARWAGQRPDAAVPRASLLEYRRRAASGMANRLAQHRQRLTGLAAQLELLNPQRTLERGYAILTDDKGAIVRAPGQLKARQHVGLRLAEGSVQIGLASVQTTLE
ncbi:exodeoxyribonuclease VII large subunit [Janthinobacterium agaricidamnosum]|uniref:Exodeoxyribonuclease 7 large subunit n=1 Tax=Janthinobacterium agaricidamnosum NBRC 102515 = DSM 9628 TaxID=1349767 RepID=W0V739_9BURK|nr:exodeoxyribonuclease VII large subunit [Janthinobacterium agaricidamnosum]CDG84644.1 exodeoxyribonuclease VII, large subunit [Janthinobacterium agaricidamnosum NBRC 102515 = DSM 9628]